MMCCRRKDLQYQILNYTPAVSGSFDQAFNLLRIIRFRFGDQIWIVNIMRVSKCFNRTMQSCVHIWKEHTNRFERQEVGKGNFPV